MRRVGRYLPASSLLPGKPCSWTTRRNAASASRPIASGRPWASGGGGRLIPASCGPGSSGVRALIFQRIRRSSFLIRASQSSIDALQFLASIRTSVIPAPRLVRMERARSCHITLLPTWAVKVCRSIPQKPAFPTSYSLGRRLGQETLSRLLLRSGLDPTASSACKHLRWSSRGRPPVDRSRVFATPKKPFQGFCSGTARDRTGPLASETKACKQRRWSSQGRPQVEHRGRRVQPRASAVLNPPPPRAAGLFGCWLLPPMYFFRRTAGRSCFLLYAGLHQLIG